MKKLLIVLALVSTGAQAQVSVDALSRVQASDDAQAEAAAQYRDQQEAYRQQQLAAQQQAQAYQYKLQVQRQAAEQARRDAAAAEAAKEHNEDREYEQQVKQLRLQAMRNEVNRQNDVINAGLARSKAETDVIQSTADANRNVSSGAKDVAINKSTSLWSKVTGK